MTETLLDVVALADGRRMTIRATTSADGERIRSLYDGLSMDDRHRRCFGALKPRSAWCRAWASIGEGGGFGLIAIVEVPGSAGHEERDRGR